MKKIEKPEAEPEPYKNMFIFSAFTVSRTKVLFILIKSLNLCAFYFSPLIARSGVTINGPTEIYEHQLKSLCFLPIYI